MKALTEGQHYLMEVVIEAGRPVTVREFIDECLGPHENPRESAIKARLDKLTKLGWLTKAQRQTRRRGRPPVQYEPVNGSVAAWTKHEAELQAAWAEVNSIPMYRIDEELLA